MATDDGFVVTDIATMATQGFRSAQAAEVPAPRDICLRPGGHIGAHDGGTGADATVIISTVRHTNWVASMS